MPLIDLLVGEGIGLIKAIPTGKGKRKMAARYLDASADDMQTLMTDLDTAALNGEVLGGFALRMIVSKLSSIHATMRTTVNAIGPDDIVDEP